MQPRERRGAQPAGRLLDRQVAVLAALWETDGQPPGELAARLGVTTPTIVKMASRMTATGLLTRRRDDRDNRLVRLYLTDAGRALREPVLAARERLHDAIVADLTAAERKQLTGILQKVIGSVSALHPEAVEHTDDV